MCRTKKTSLKPGLPLYRFQISFLLNRSINIDINSRVLILTLKVEVSVLPLLNEFMGFTRRHPVRGIKGDGRDSCVLVPNRSVERAYSVSFTCFCAHTQHDPSLFVYHIRKITQLSFEVSKVFQHL